MNTISPNLMTDTSYVGIVTRTNNLLITCFINLIMNDEIREYIEKSYKEIQEKLIELNKVVQSGKMTPEDFIKKRKEMIDSYQAKRKEMEKDEV